MIDKEGELIWQRIYNDILSTPIKIIDDSIIVLFADSLRSLSINNGEENWVVKHEGKKIIQSKGGITAEFANLIYYLLPNSYIGEFDTLLGQKNVSNANSQHTMFFQMN